MARRNGGAICPNFRSSRDRRRRTASILSALAVVLGLAFAAGSVSADQKDPRLDNLFVLLKAAPDIPSAGTIERSIWTIWLESDDDAVTRLMGRGMAAMTRRDFRAALDAFDRIVRIAPGFAEGWNKRATVNYLLGEFADSLRDIDRTLTLEPRHFGALSGRGLVLLELENAKLALRSFEAALRIHPNLPGASQRVRVLRQRLGEIPI
jgi:tetratricopeptide (TPR) repeat protein